MRKVPFTPQKNSDLKPGVFLYRKDDPFSRFRVVKEMKPIVHHGNTMRDMDGNPVGYLWTVEAFQKYDGINARQSINLGSISRMTATYDFFTLGI